MTDLPFHYPDAAPANAAAPQPKCRRHRWVAFPDGSRCDRCGKAHSKEAARRGRNNRKRGTTDELRVAEILGGRKVGPLGHEWDVEIEGYLRAQCKKLDTPPSLNQVTRWLDAIPQGPSLRAVTIADTPGAGRKTRRLIVLDLEEFASWHGRAVR